MCMYTYQLNNVMLTRNLQTLLCCIVLFIGHSVHHTVYNIKMQSDTVAYIMCILDR